MAEFKMETPSMVASILQEIQAVGGIVSVSDAWIVIDIPAESEFDLGYEVRELEDTLRTLLCEPVSLERIDP